MARNLETKYGIILKRNIDKKRGTTKAICNAGKVLNINILPINKVSAKLKDNRFKIPHYA